MVKKDELAKKTGVRLNIGCGANNESGWYGIDIRKLPGVDLVWDIEKTPWPMQAESVLVATSSHVLEHLNPHGGVFMGVMDEIWRVLKPGAQFAFVVPYAGSPGFWQDPTHCNGITETTMYYFDPLHSSGLYQFYEPAPWAIELCAMKPEGNLEVVLRKRLDDRSYHSDNKVHYGKK